MNVIETNDAGIRNAAREIVQSHTPEEIARIVESCNPLVAQAIKALVARHGMARVTALVRKRPIFWPGRRK